MVSVLESGLRCLGVYPGRGQWMCCVLGQGALFSQSFPQQRFFSGGPE